MDKQDELTGVICVARIGIGLPKDSTVEPSDDDVRIAKAVRSYLMSDERVSCVAKAIHDVLENDDDSEGGGYIRAARAALSAAGGGHGE